MHRRSVLFAVRPVSLAIILSASPSFAATIEVPPVTVTQLAHQVEPTFVMDAVNIPTNTTCGSECAGVGYSTGPLTAAIATGDVLTIRIQAPAGKKFVVHAPVVGLGSFFACLYWQSGSGTASTEEPHTITFENLLGTPPTETYSLMTLGDARQVVQVWKTYQYTTAFEFTAFRAEMTAGSPNPTVPREYSTFGSWMHPSFGASVPNGNPDVPYMEIVDIPTPTERGSWGRIKLLYR